MPHPDCNGQAFGRTSSPLAAIVRCERGSTLDLTILSPALRGVWTHFVDAHRTYPCLGPHSQCYFDHRNTSLRWQGWLQVQTGVGRPSRFACITEAAARDCPVLFTSAGQLRGRQLVLQRADHSKRGRMVALVGPMRPSANVPASVDLRQWLLGLWEQPSLWPLGLGGISRREALQAHEVEWDDDPYTYKKGHTNGRS
jgi:hypothetical protein